MSGMQPSASSPGKPIICLRISVFASGDADLFQAIAKCSSPRQ
jgi:hypothetical protein